MIIILSIGWPSVNIDITYNSAWTKHKNKIFSVYLQILLGFIFLDKKKKKIRNLILTTIVIKDSYDVFYIATLVAIFSPILMVHKLFETHP